MLPVWLCYLSDNVTCVAMLPVWQCHLYDDVIYVTMLPAWQCYLCDNVTCVAMSPVWLIPVWLCHLHDNVTCMTVLPAWQCHLCDDVTCVAVTCVATLISASWPESFRTNDIIGWSSCTLSHQTQHMLSQFTNASTLGVKLVVKKFQIPIDLTLLWIYLLNIWEFVYFVCGLSPPKRRIVWWRNFVCRCIPTVCWTCVVLFL